jgi:hypothetical protein
VPRRRKIRVSATELRAMFNEGRYYERVQAGELLEVVGYNRHPCPPRVNEPFCTRSQTVHYVDLREGRVVAVVHQYLREDGSLGASGRPDPKRISQGTTIYVVELPQTG